MSGQFIFLGDMEAEIGIPGEGKDGTCPMCGSEEGPRLSCGELSICEPCAFLASWAWRSWRGEVTPGQEVPKTRSQTARLMVVRLRVVADREGAEGDERQAVDELEGSYEVLVDQTGEIPGASSVVDVDLVQVARGRFGVDTWASQLDLLYAGAGPGGRRNLVYLARSWHQGATPRGFRWVSFDEYASDRESVMREGIVQAWRNIHDHLCGSSGDGRPFVAQLREAAHSHLVLWERWYRDRSVDSSMLRAYREAMDADESQVVRILEDEMKAEIEGERRKATHAIGEPEEDGVVPPGEEDVVPFEDDGEGESP